jgi:hypothetical protein
VLRAVDLDELADALPPITRLVNLRAPLLPIGPKPSLEHPDTKCLAANEDAVDLSKLLDRQGGPKVRVLLADQIQRPSLERRRRLPVTRPGHASSRSAP